MILVVRTHRTNISDCEPCPPGRYCQNRGATEVTGMCKAGHICYGLALYNDPVYNNDTSGNKTAILWGDTCHPGYYCPQGTSVMVPCPRGTYNPDRSGTSEAASCKSCDPGKYCNGTALTEVTGQLYFLWLLILHFVTVLVKIFTTCVRIHNKCFMDRSLFQRFIDNLNVFYSSVWLLF